MSTSFDPKGGPTPPIKRRRPPPGARNRGAVDALQTKIAVNLQNLDPGRFEEQLQENVAELPDACGCDAAFLALFQSDLSTIQSIVLIELRVRRVQSTGPFR